MSKATGQPPNSYSVVLPIFVELCSIPSPCFQHERGQAAILGGLQQCFMPDISCHDGSRLSGSATLSGCKCLNPSCMITCLLSLSLPTHSSNIKAHQNEVGSLFYVSKLVLSITSLYPYPEASSVLSRRLRPGRRRPGPAGPGGSVRRSGTVRACRPAP